MTTDLLDQHDTVGDALHDRGSTDRVRGLVRRRAVSDALSLAGHGVAAAVRDEVVDEVEACAARLLGTSTVGVLAAGWRCYGGVMAAARATADTPGLTRFVSLAPHRISHAETVTIDVAVGALHFPPAELTLTVVADVDAVLLIVASGELAGIRGGRCTLHATLTLHDETVAEQTVEIELPAERRFHPAYRLLPDERGTSADDHTT